jgi:4-hydroxy-3-methylbut-2-enyl diphosphate reductase
MKVLRASHLGMCFGVRDAIQLATQAARRRPLTVLGQLVHNDLVLRRLEAVGARTARTAAEIATSAVMISAHGASERAVAALRERGHDVLEATCPLVRLAHHAVQRLVRDGYHPVIVGQRDHVEVRGLTGDLATFDVVLSEADVAQLAPRPRFGVAAQTTQPIERVRALAQAIRRRFPDSPVKLVDTVCRPTKERQAAAVHLAQSCDIVVVIGGAASNNTRELVATCVRECGRVHHVQSAADLRADWFHPRDVVGVTAGTSTPDSTIDEIEARLRVWAREFEPFCGVTASAEATDLLAIH